MRATIFCASVWRFIMRKPMSARSARVWRRCWGESSFSRAGGRRWSRSDRMRVGANLHTRPLTRSNKFERPLPLSGQRCGISPGTEFNKLPAQMLRQVRAALRFVQVRGRVLGFKIAPSLKCPTRLRDGAMQLRVEVKAAALAVIVGHVVDRDNALADADHTFDHPIERAAVKHLVHALRPHAGAAHRRDVWPLFFFGALDLADLPLGEIFDAIGPDAEFHDVNRHFDLSRRSTPRHRQLAFARLPDQMPGESRATAGT